MAKYTVSGTFTRELIRTQEASNPREAVRSFKAETKTVPDHVEENGEFYDVLGICELCDLGILLGDKYGYDPDHCCFTCESCTDEFSAR